MRALRMCDENTTLHICVCGCMYKCVCVWLRVRRDSAATIAWGVTDPSLTIYWPIQSQTPLLQARLDKEAAEAVSQQGGGGAEGGRKKT